MRTYKECPICKKQISASNYQRHVDAHSKPYRYLRFVDHDGLNCKYCGKLCKNKNSLAQHEIRCSKNTNRLDISLAGLKAMQEKNQKFGGWNKGLTKETDERVAKNAINVQKTMQQKVDGGWKPYFATEEFWTEERKEQRSEDKIKLYAEHPELHPNRILASNKKMTYPEKVAADWLDSKQIKYIYQYKTKFGSKSRYVDFYLEDYKLYIEIDGEYWHKKNIDKDIAKDKFALEAQQITTLRIKPKLGVIKQLESYFNK